MNGRQRFNLEVIVIFLAALALLFGLVYVIYRLEENHAHKAVQAHRVGVASALRLDPEGDPRPARKASRSRALSQATHAAQGHAAVQRPQARVRRAGASTDLRTPSGFEAWRTSWSAHAVAQCESGNDNSAHSSSGTYRGKWQMDADFWRTYGGLRYASSPELASERSQDLVAYRGFLARGWQPWTCARIVGVYP